MKLDLDKTNLLGKLTAICVAHYAEPRPRQMLQVVKAAKRLVEGQAIEGHECLWLYKALIFFPERDTELERLTAQLKEWVFREIVNAPTPLSRP